MTRPISTLVLDAKKIAFVACALSFGSPRINLEGVRIESTKSKILMIGTDGNVMLMARSEGQDVEAADVLHVTKDFLSACRKPKAVSVTVGFGTWRVTDRNGEFVASGICSPDGVHWRYDHTTPADLPYPEWRRTSDKSTIYDSPVYGLTSRTISQIAQAAKIEHLGFSLYGANPHCQKSSQPILVVFSVDDYSGLIMPASGFGTPAKALSPVWCLSYA